MKCVRQQDQLRNPGLWCQGRGRNHAAALLFLGIGLGFPATIAAQNSTQPNAPTVGTINTPDTTKPGSGPAVDETPETLTTEHILLYLAKEKVLAGGVGFINAQLGDPLASIIDIWGAPQSSRQTRLFRYNEIRYQPDPDLRVVFAGRERVKSITITGTSRAPFRTRRGARLGMQPITVVRIYSNEKAQTKGNRIAFNKLGISFYFENNRVSRIVAYPPD